MNKKLTDEQIEAVCRELLSVRRTVTVLDVQEWLLKKHRAMGKTSRLGPILKTTRDAMPINLK